jgi:hypothetical protein
VLADRLARLSPAARETGVHLALTLTASGASVGPAGVPAVAAIRVWSRELARDYRRLASGGEPPALQAALQEQTAPPLRVVEPKVARRHLETGVEEPVFAPRVQTAEPPQVPLDELASEAEREQVSSRQEPRVLVLPEEALRRERVQV